MLWVNILYRLAATGTFLLLGECNGQSMNQLVASLLHYSRSTDASHLGDSRGFLAIHSVGGTVHALACLADTIAWLVIPPMGCVVGAVSNVGSLLQLPGRFGLEH